MSRLFPLNAHGHTVLNLTQSSSPVFNEPTEPNAIPRVDCRAYTGGAVRLDNLPHPVVFDLASMRVLPTVAMLYGHDREQPIGHWDNVRVSQNPPIIDVSGLLSVDNERSRNIRAAAKNKFPWQASVGLVSDNIVDIPKDKQVIVNGQTFVGPLHVAYQASLREISLLALGADPNTQVSISASLGVPMTYEAWLASIAAALALDVATVTPEQTTALQSIYTEMTAAGSTEAAQTSATIAAKATIKALNASASIRINTGAGGNNGGNNPPNDDPIVIRRRLEAAESRRINSINTFARTYNNPVVNGVPLSARAIEEGWDETRTELEMMRTSRPQNVNVTGTNGRDSSVNPMRVLSAALAQTTRAQRPYLEANYTPQELDTAHRHYRGRVGLQQILIEAAQLNGYTGRGSFGQNHREILRAAFSTMDVANLFSTNINRTLMEGFMSVDETWRRISKRSSTGDFKEFQNYRGVGSFTFRDLAPNGMIEHGKMLEDTFSNQVGTKAIMYVITRQQQRNDDLGVFDDLPRMIGRGGKIKFLRDFWTEFLDNAAFFVAGNNNVSTGALDIAGLNTASGVFQQLKDTNGDYIMSTPKFLLVPGVLMPTAQTLFSSMDIVSGNTAATPSNNPHAGKYEPITSPYLQDTTITGNSSLAYYLLSDPADVPVIDAAFLDGREEPIVETADTDFNTLGIQIRGYWDYGVRLLDPKGGVRSTGA